MSRAEPQFFINTKREELRELTKLLEGFHLEKDIKKQREIIKKVIACMTLGIDVSPLLVHMIKISQTPDLIIKKKVYLYLVDYSEDKECLIMAIGTFTVACKDKDYKIRVLALRTLSSLKFNEAVPYTVQIMKSMLNDPHPYVRKTACIACIKLYKDSAKTMRNSEFIEELYKLIKDVDAQVVINAIVALDEIQEDQGGIAITRKLIIYLLNRIKEFSEWGQSNIINLLTRYKPKDEGEMIDILNILEDRLSHADAGVILAITKVFMSYTKNNAKLNKQLMKRLQAPLITLMTSNETTGNHEVTYVILHHILLIVSRYDIEPMSYDLFRKEHKHFFCKMEEYSYIKDIKIEIMSYIACELNMRDIINELSEYVTDVDVDFAKKAVECIGKIVVRNPTMVKPIIENLLKFFKFRIEYISSKCIIVFGILLRKYPQFIDLLIPAIEGLHKLINKAEAKCALIWIMGEYGEKIVNAPYVLEYYTGGSPNEQGSQLMFYSLLNATLKLFFKRPGECQSILGKLLKDLILYSNSSDLRERAMMYYNLLSSNIEAAKEIIMGKEEVESISSFWEDEITEEKEKIEKEFNTFSVIYNEPQEKFLKKDLVQKMYQQERQQDNVQQEEAVKQESNNEPVPTTTKDLLVILSLRIGFG
jgi:AP-4 complex subunit beta-1